MKLEFQKLPFTEKDANDVVDDNLQWFIGAARGDKRPGTLDYFGPQNVGVHIVEPRQGSDPQRDGVIIIPRSYEAAYAPYAGSDPAYDLEAKRDAVIANVLGKTVVGVDTPGFGFNPDASPQIGQILAAATGSMAPHARVQLEAILAALKQAGIYDPKIEKQLRLEFIGYSMGNIAVVDMLGQLDRVVENADVTHATFVEAVNDHAFMPVGHNGLLESIARETNDVNTNRYFDQNARNGLVVGYDRDEDDYTLRHPGREMRQRDAKDRGNATNVSIGTGMAVHGWGSRAKARLARHQVPVVDMIRTNGSEVARPEKNAMTAYELAQVVPDFAMTTVIPGQGEPDHHHPIWQSLPGTATIMDRTLRKK